MEKFPPLITPASGWPMVPLTEYTPPVLVPPPPSMVNQSMVKDCACTNEQESNNSINRGMLSLTLILSPRRGKRAATPLEHSRVSFVHTVVLTSLHDTSDWPS